jgi:hypothetical protein
MIVFSFCARAGEWKPTRRERSASRERTFIINNPSSEIIQNSRHEIKVALGWQKIPVFPKP